MKGERNGSKTSIDRRRFVKNGLTAAGAATVWDSSSANLRVFFQLMADLAEDVDEARRGRG
jgi:hypothetical protein